MRKFFEEWGLDESDILAKTHMKYIADLERLERVIIGIETAEEQARKKLPPGFEPGRGMR